MSDLPIIERLKDVEQTLAELELETLADVASEAASVINELVGALDAWVTHLDGDGEDATFDDEMRMLDAARRALSRARGEA